MSDDRFFLRLIIVKGKIFLKEELMKQENNSKGMPLEDEKIIELYWNRNERAIEETDKKYGKYLYTIAYNIIHDNLDCEECLNDTYLGTWNRIPPQRPSAFQVFLSKIMRNIAVDKYRKNRTSKNIPSELVVSLAELDNCMESSPSVEEEYAIKETIKILNNYLREIDEEDEFMFVCRYYYADYLSDIAKMLGVSEKTVYRALVRMRSELRERLNKEGFDQ